MMWVAILSAAAAMVFLARLFILKAEMKRAVRQLHLLNQGETGKKIDVAFLDRDMVALAEAINGQIDLTRQADAEKKRTEHELKQAISNISDDIRTPMTSILGYIQLIEEEHLSEDKKKEYTQIVRKGALRLKTLLEDFFELSIIESPDYALGMDQITLNELVIECLAGFYEAFNKRQIEPAIHMPEGEISILGDASAVNRVIENLLTNAIRYTSGDVAIVLEKTSSSVRLTIRNPAPHVRQADLMVMFERFYKADPTRRENGTGLGLSIAKSLMSKMNGSLIAELQGNELSMICEWKVAGTSQ
ncbi:sensor histidine kinase [Paenibacillus sp. MMS18-CY102]|uniref:sensor histidine kinase n=1 Tax=Paenibacillus sp. MMS18-CY102 TaxID=2682849 RepID=UPI00136628FE|nr:HAMP domain-containing sensor histidine kinase [Paenibacillus sp. MMS18-CY102]MWC30220.1 sensor histidine kinase [Paenibacillus sp. MMS18-CY102]